MVSIECCGSAEYNGDYLSPLLAIISIAVCPEP